MDDDGITPMENFAGTAADIYLKNHHKWVFPVYVLDEILQGNISGLPKWETLLHADIYLVHSPFNTV